MSAFGIIVIALVAGGIIAFLWIRFGAKKAPETVSIDYTPSEAMMSVTEMELLVKINEHRSRLNLSELKTDKFSRALAQEHLAYMINKGYPNHDNFEYRAEDLFERHAENVLENVAKGYQEASGVFDGYLTSPRHKAQIESAGLTHVGIASGRVDGKLWNVCLFVKFPNQ